MKEFSDEAIVAAYDSEADAAYIWFVPRDTCYRIERTVDVGHNVHLDLDANGHVLGIELLYPRSAQQRRETPDAAGREDVSRREQDIRRRAHTVDL